MSMPVHPKSDYPGAPHEGRPVSRLGIRLSLAAALCVAALGLQLAMSSSDDAEMGATHSLSVQAGGLIEATAAPAPRQISSAPASFEDAARLLELGVAGDLSVDMHTRSALDILLASLGPEPTPAGLQRLEDQLRRSMPGEAATQAMVLVRRYDTYQRAAAAEAAAQQPPTTTEELKALLDKTAALRRQHFGEDTARALFGAEEEQTRADMALNAIQADPTLSAQQKATQIAAMQPQASLAITEMDKQIASLQQQGASPAQIEQVRARYLGDEAAQALTATQDQAAQWESRYQAYAEQKKAIVATAAPDMAAQLDAALRQHFKPEELAAARAYDRNRTP